MAHASGLGQNFFKARLDKYLARLYCLVCRTSLNTYCHSACSVPLCNCLPLPQSSLFLAQAALRAPREVAFAMHSWPLLVQACLLAPPVMADKAKLAIVFTYFFLLVQACLRAPPMVADEAKLAIVFTYFFLLFFFSFYFTPSAFHPLRGISRA